MDLHMAQFERRALELEADFSARGRTSANTILQNSVDRDFDCVSAADNFTDIPFAERLLRAVATACDEGRFDVGGSGDFFCKAGGVHRDQISGTIEFELRLKAGGPLLI